MDENYYEIASIQEEHARAQGIEAAQAELNCEYRRYPDFDFETCHECGDPMPDARLEMGRVRCTLCQSILEAKDRQRAKHG